MFKVTQLLGSDLYRGVRYGQSSSGGGAGTGIQGFSCRNECILEDTVLKYSALQNLRDSEISLFYTSKCNSLHVLILPTEAESLSGWQAAVLGR